MVNRHNSSKLLSFPENCVFAFWRRDPRWRISAILDFMGPIMGSWKSPGTTSYRASIWTIALTCLVFEKIVFLDFGIKIQDGWSVHHLGTGCCLPKTTFKTKIGGAGIGLHPKIWDRLHIYATVVASDFKFGTQLEFRTSLSKNDVLYQN